MGDGEIELWQLANSRRPRFRVIQCENNSVKITSLNYGHNPIQDESQSDYCYAPEWYTNKDHCKNEQILDTL